MSGTTGELVNVPINFDSDGAKVSTITFSVDYDESCLEFDDTAPGPEDIPYSVTFPGLDLVVFGQTRVAHDPEDTDGEIDAVIKDNIAPFAAAPDGVIMEVALAVIEEASCNGDGALVGFSSVPPVEFGTDEGVRLNGETEGGAVRISTPTLTPTPTPTHTPTPTPISYNPSLTIPDDISADPGQNVTVPITLDSDGAKISGVSFSLVYDESCLSFDPSDDNSDGLPDSISLSLPADVDRTLVAPAPEGAAREVDVVLADIVFPLVAIEDGVIVMIELNVADDAPCWGVTVDVGFWADTPATYFDTDMQEVDGTTHDGSIRISVPTPTPTFTPTPTPTPTFTPEPVQDGPSLTIPQEIPGSPGQTVVAPIAFDADGKAISSITFAVDYDQTCLSFDATDADFDGVPDSVTLEVPAAFITQVQFANEAIRFVLFAQGLTMPDGVFANVTLTVSDKEECRGATAEVRFSFGPNFGNNFGRPVSGWSQDGSVKIADD